MNKHFKVIGMSIFFILGLLSLVFVSFASAQQEQLTITTYYPSPFGSYNELTTNRLAIGSSATMSGVNGVLSFQGLSGEDPISMIPANRVTEGQIYYNSDRHEYRFFGRNGWQSLTSGIDFSVAGKSTIPPQSIRFNEEKIITLYSDPFNSTAGVTSARGVILNFFKNSNDSDLKDTILLFKDMDNKELGRIWSNTQTGATRETGAFVVLPLKNGQFKVMADCVYGRCPSNLNKSLSFVITSIAYIY
jgi:hypothetical protein